MIALAPLGAILFVAIGFAIAALIADRAAKRREQEPPTQVFNQLPLEAGVLGHVGQDWIDWNAIEWWPEGQLLIDYEGSGDA